MGCGEQGGRGFRYVTGMMSLNVFASLLDILNFPVFYKSNCLYYTVLIIRDTIKNYDSVSNTLCQNLVLLGVLVAKIFQKDE